MAWWRKVVFGTIGLSLGGPLGGLIGLAIGHAYDVRSESESDELQTAETVEDVATLSQEQVQLLFFVTTFSVMGALAKADGRVTGDEIDLVEQAIDEFDFIPDQRRLAIELFNKGKDPNFDIWGTIQQFKKQCPRSRSLHKTFLEIQLQLALSDGELHPNELNMLQRMAHLFGISVTEFSAMLAREKQTYSRRHHPEQESTADTLQAAYRVLGVNPGDSDDEVKRAYRRCMNQHHPDKLVARGLPEEMIAAATEKTKEIQRAWARIKQARNI